MDSDVASRVPFSALCKICERISQKQKKDEKNKVLEDFILEWRQFHDKLYAVDNQNTTDTFFPAMRLLLPQCERDRGAYGIKETLLAKLYIEILCLAKDGDAAQKLLNYRAPKTAKAEVGDFASVAELVLKNRCPSKGSLKISDINKHLDSISIHNAEKNRAEVRRNLKFLMCNTTAQEQKWLIRMILKEMKMGISEQSILKLFHPDAKDLYDVTSSLSKVCLQLIDPSTRLHEIEVSLFSPFRPMLAARAKPTEVEKLMNHEPFIIDTKLDGERVQLHKDGNSYKYFSRNGLEYTHMYGSSPLEGSFTPCINKQFKKDVTSCILDGEMCGWNKILDCIGTKGQNFDVKTLQADDPEYQPCFFVFDVLMFNGKILTNKPLRDRLEYIDKVFSSLEGRIMNTPQKTARTNQDVINALNEAIDQREEGIVLKNPSSIYKPNSRGWFKVKPEYIDNLMNEMDLIILGGYFGEGRRSGLLSHFLLGVAATNDSEPEEFHSFVKVGSGYSLQELHHLLNKMKDNWQIYDKKNPPKSIILASGHKEKPDLWIEPDKSQIVQVKAAEITNSQKFKTGCTLRFPRVEKVRYDKTWNQCLNLNELNDLKNEAEGKLASKHMQDVQDDESGLVSPKKRRLVNRYVQSTTVAAQFRQTDVSDVEKVSESFKGKEFCIMSDAGSYSKADLEKIVAKLGGTFVQNPDVNTFCVISDKLTQKTKNAIQSEKYNVVKAKWLLSCHEVQSLIQWTPFDMWFTKEETKLKFALNFDKFGDSYTENITDEMIRLVFGRISQREIDLIEMGQTEIAELEYDLFPNCSQLGLFRTFKIHVDKNKTGLNDLQIEMVEKQLRYFGALINDEISESTTHVIVNTCDFSRLELVKEVNKSRNKLFYLVTEEWVFDCIKSRHLQNERFYYP